MENTWSITELKPGIFHLHFKSLKDRYIIIAQCPWTIKGFYFLLQPWPEQLTLEEVHFPTLPFLGPPNRPFTCTHP